MLLLSAKTQHVRGEVEKPRKNIIWTLRDREIVIRKEFGCEDRCVFNLISALYTQHNHIYYLMGVLTVL